jgi:hypothetical protein
MEQLDNPDLDQPSDGNGSDRPPSDRGPSFFLALSEVGGSDEEVDRTYELRTHKPDYDKNRRRAFGTPQREANETGQITQGSPKHSDGPRLTPPVLYPHIRVSNFDRTLKTRVDAVGGEREAAAKRLRYRMRDLEAERQQLERDYLELMSVADVRRPDVPHMVMNNRESSTQTNYFPTPMSEVMNYEREIAPHKVTTTTFEKHVEIPHAAFEYHSVGDRHPSLQFSSRLAGATLRTQGLDRFVPECRNLSVSSGTTTNKATREVGIRAT